MAATQVSLSARFNSADSAYLNRTPSVASNRKTYTFSLWAKRSTLSTRQNFFSVNSPNVGNNGFSFEWLDTNSIGVYFDDGVLSPTYIGTTPIYRDPGSWYHIVLAVDATQATSGDRVKIYVNGVSVAYSFLFGSSAITNANTLVNSTNTHNIGVSQRGTSTRDQYLNGYITEFNFIDGLALTPASFGQTNSNTGVWEPRQYTGSFGTNGFYLQFNKEGLEVESLIVAGGGGGGVVGGGGGGAGGYRTSTTTVALGVAYTITVGAGGTAGTSLNGGNGSNSVFSSITSTGGGGGGGDTRFSSGVAKSGGSGGGGGGGNWGTEAAGAGNTPSTSPSQGNNGGTGSASSPNYGGAGGGGAGATGGNGSGTTGGTGAAGTASSITGSSVTRAGGGGGGTYNGGTAGNGGSGGGGNGGVYLTPGTGSAATSGTANTGGGGGGGGISGGSAQSGGGGSGVVIIKIADTRTATFSGGVTQTSTTSGGFKIYTVTATSTTSETVTFS
jgi:hypothetical protein